MIDQSKNFFKFNSTVRDDLVRYEN